MKKFVCSVCGYVHEGDAAPERCPVCKVPAEKFFKNIHKYGNTSAASIPIALTEMDEQGLLLAGKKVIIVGFGAGFTWGSMLLEF